MFVLTACNNELEEELPDGLIEKSEFILVLADVQLLEISFNQKMFKEDDPRKKMPILYEQVFAKNNITREEFDISYEWWGQHPDDMEEIYEGVIERLTIMEAERSLNTHKNKEEE